MSDLVVTVDKVRELGNKLRFIATEFEGADDIASDYGRSSGVDRSEHEWLPIHAGFGRRNG